MVTNLSYNNFLAVKLKAETRLERALNHYMTDFGPFTWSPERATTEYKDALDDYMDAYQSLNSIDAEFNAAGYAGRYFTELVMIKSMNESPLD